MFDNSFTSQTHIKLLFYGLIALISLYVLTKGAVIAPDSGGYLAMSSYRSLGYPLFLKAYQFFFQDAYGVLVVIQVGIGVLSIDYFLRTLNRYFYFSCFVHMMIFLFLLAPYFVIHGIGNHILTEALCYPLFFMTLSFLIRFLKNNDLRSLVVAIGFALLLTLTRSQFIFLWPSFFILITYMLYKNGSFSSFLRRLLILASVIFSGQMIERTYSYVLTGSFKIVPFVGYQTVVLPLYLSKESDADLFEKPHERAFFQETYNNLQKRKAHRTHSNDTNPLFHYDGLYNMICHQISGAASLKHLSSNPYIRDGQLISISLTLLKSNFSSYITHYVKSIINNLGGYWSFFTLITFSFLVFVRSFSRPSLVKETFLMLFMLNMGNIMLIALFEPLISRYTLYTATPLWSFILVLLCSLFMTHKLEKAS